MTTSAIFPAPNKMALAGMVASRVQIIDIFQLSASYKRITDLSDKPTSLESKTNASVQYGNESLQIVVMIQCAVHAETDQQKEFMNIESQFIAVYQVPSMDGLTKEHIDAFGEVNGPYNVWPYWREFVQNATSRMGLTPLTLPVHRPRDQHKAGAMVAPTDNPPSKAKAAKRATKPA